MPILETLSKIECEKCGNVYWKMYEGVGKCLKFVKCTCNIVFMK